MAPEIKEWLEFKVSEQVKTLNSLEEVNTFIAENEVAAVGYFKEDTKEKKGYQEIIAFKLIEMIK